MNKQKEGEGNAWTLPHPKPRDALEGKGPQRRPQKRFNKTTNNAESPNQITTNQ